jgi:hypothetical protein
LRSFTEGQTQLYFKVAADAVENESVDVMHALNVARRMCEVCAHFVSEGRTDRAEHAAEIAGLVLARAASRLAALEEEISSVEVLIAKLPAKVPAGV